MRSPAGKSARGRRNPHVVDQPGAAEVAGAVIAPDTLSRAAAAGLDAQDALSRNDAHSFFGALGDQVVPGPTLTNVNDFRAILIRPA